MDPENPAPTPPTSRPPAPLPESENVRSYENYEDPDNLERPVTSIQWPAPYDEVRVRSSSSQPPALPPARPLSTQTTITGPVIHQPMDMPMSVLGGRVESSGRRESSEHPQPLMPLARTISAANKETSPSHAMVIMASTDSRPPDVPKKKHSSHVIPRPPRRPPPPPPPEERRPSEVMPYISISGENGLYEQPVSPDAPERGERQYDNSPSPRNEPRGACDTSSMPSIDEATERCDSNRPVLPRTESSNSDVLDSFGYVECIV